MEHTAMGVMNEDRIQREGRLASSLSLKYNAMKTIKCYLLILSRVISAVPFLS